MSVPVTVGAKRNHQLVTITIPAVTTWQTIEFPSWVRRFEIINYDTDDIFATTNAVDGAAGTGGVPVRGSGGTYSAPCGGPQGAYLAIRHASGSYTLGLALFDGEEV